MTEQAEATRRAAVSLVRAADPRVEARALAAELGADVAADLRSAEREVRVRVEAGRRALGDRAADDALLARADAIRATVAQPPPISSEQVAELERLAGDLTRAARIRQRTESRVAETLKTRLATSAGLTIHPEAIRSAAQGVAEAERAIAAAEQALAGLGDQPPAPAPAPPTPAAPPLFHHDDGPDPVLQRPHDVFDELALDKRRATAQGLGLFLLVAGAGIVAMVFGQATVGALLVLIGAAAGGVVGIRGHQAASQQDADRVDAAARLDGHVVEIDLPIPAPEPAVPTWEPAPEAVPGTAVAPVAPDPADLWLQERGALLAERAGAEELLRLALTRWHHLVGAEADPHDPEPVIRAHDPQLHYDPHLAEGSPTVRAVAAFHRSVQARWRVMWASLGVDDAPEPADLDTTLEEILADSAQAAADLRALEDAERRVEARAIVGRPLVLVEPSTWIDDGRLGQLLSSVPPEGRAVLVERVGPDSAPGAAGVS